MSDKKIQYQLEIYLPSESKDSKNENFRFDTLIRKNIDLNDLKQFINKYLSVDEQKNLENNLINKSLSFLLCSTNDDLKLNSKDYEAMKNLVTRNQFLKQLEDKLKEFENFKNKLEFENKKLKKEIANSKKLFIINDLKEPNEIYFSSMNIFPSGNLISVSRDKSIKIYNNNLEII